MSEWLKEHAWKACVGETLPWVRIPLSPPVIPLVHPGEIGWQIIPETWVRCLWSKGLSMGSSDHFSVEVAEIVVHEADEPDALAHLFYA